MYGKFATWTELCRAFKSALASSVDDPRDIAAWLCGGNAQYAHDLVEQFQRRGALSRSPGLVYYTEQPFGDPAIDSN